MWDHLGGYGAFLTPEDMDGRQWINGYALI